ncbi:penicillin-binding protein 2 [Verrucomicrobiota bacterium]
MNPHSMEILRVRVVLVCMIAVYCSLGAALWRIQVVNTSSYRTSLDSQSMRRVRLPAARGSIFDRHGLCLAGNRSSFCLAVYVEELRQPGRMSNTVNRVEEVLDSVESELGLPRQIARSDILNHLQRRRPLPLLAWRDIDERALARWAESDKVFPGVDVYVEPERRYPHGPLASHVLGYVGRMSPQGDFRFLYYLPEMEGRRGVEKALNSVLAGVPGGRVIRVDVSGYKYDEDIERKAQTGEDVFLTIDTRIQRLLEEQLAGKRGAGIVMDPRNGDVLALASSPAFDAASLKKTPRFRDLVADPGKPLFNRAVSGLYPPGSIFKLVVAAASIENRLASGSQHFTCPGHFEVGGLVFGCWRSRGHGPIGMVKAIEQSCNAYFCQLGLLCGHERIYRMAEALGFGRPTGVGFDGERAGLLPDSGWNLRHLKVGWRAGDTCNISIGQGALLVTPLQIAVYVSAIANGGDVYRPRLVLPDPDDPARGGEPVNRMRWSKETLRVVRSGMYQVVQSDTGTGKRARIEGVAMGGKTGSAEYGPKDDRKKHGWMMVFAPFKEPRYAAAIVIEDAQSGGLTTAPLIRELMAGIFGVKTAQSPPGTG